MIYEDFHLRIAPDGPEGFQRKARFREQRAVAPLVLPHETSFPSSLPAKTPAGVARDLTISGCRVEQAASPEEMGNLLFRALFDGEIGRLFETACGACGEDPNRALRLRLHFPPREKRTWRLQSLPWELLYHAEDRRFLALNRRTPVVRSLDTSRPLRVLPSKLPLEVLIAMANPSGTSLLDLQAEREKIESSLSRIDHTRIAVLEQATLRGLRIRLREGCFHIIHFMGHGVGFDEESGEGALLLETREGEAVPLSATDLAELFEGLEAPQLVVLNACKTAVTSEAIDPVRSVAASLVVAGLPAVLAQRAAIQDDAALIMAEELYRRLAQGDSIETAVVEARLALRSERRSTGDWAIPALFVRPDPIVVLPLSEALVGTSPPPAPEPVAPEAIPRFVQNIRTGRVGKQTTIQGDTVYYHKESGGE